MRKSRKIVAILATLALLATLLVPMVTPAAAATTYSMSNVAVVQAGNTVPIGTLVISGDAAAFASASSDAPSILYLSLPVSPSGYGLQVNGLTLTTSPQNIPSSMLPQVNGVSNALQPGDITINGVAGTETTVSGVVYYRSIMLKVVNSTNKGNPALIDLPLIVNIPGGVSGNIDLTATAPASSGFSSGSVTIAKVNPGAVVLAVENVPSFGSGKNTSGTIDVKETNSGGLTGSPLLKFTLPPGFSWDNTISTPPYFFPFWGKDDLGAINANTFKWSVSSDGRTLNVDLNSDRTLKTATYWSFNWPIKDDPSIAKTGDVTVTVGGGSSSSPTSLVVGHYGEYGVTISALEANSLTAGKVEQKLGRIQIQENLANSLIDKRTITLTLPSGVVWNSGPSVDIAASDPEGVSFSNWTAIGSDGRTIQATVTVPNGGTGSAAKIVLKDASVTPAIDFSGNVDVTVGGSEGLTGTLTLGKVAPSVKATASSTPDVKIGIAGQNAGDVTITETAGGNIDSSITVAWLDPSSHFAADTTKTGEAQIILKAPQGVTFAAVPTVAVTSGDLQLDATGVTTGTSAIGEGLLYIPIKSGSTQASTIKISGIKLTIDRTVPEGPITLGIRGTAVNEATFDANASGVPAGASELFPNSTNVATVNVANVVTPASSEQKAKVVFTINDTKYTVNGVEQTMDVAPYIKDGRTFVPVRYAAQAVGVTPENILYSDGKVTLIKGDKVVQLTIGSNVMLINGIAINMDVAAEISNDRTMLPFRWVAQALGAKVSWDEATQTVTMEL